MSSNRNSDPLRVLRDMPGPRGMYYRWLIESVLIEGRTTLWCARHIGADPDIVKYDFDRIVTKGIRIPPPGT